MQHEKDIQQEPKVDPGAHDVDDTATALPR